MLPPCCLRSRPHFYLPPYSYVASAAPLPFNLFLSFSYSGKITTITAVRYGKSIRCCEDEAAAHVGINGCSDHANCRCEYGFVVVVVVAGTARSSDLMEEADAVTVRLPDLEGAEAVDLCYSLVEDETLSEMVEACHCSDGVAVDVDEEEDCHGRDGFVG
ncbi:hypothetical protein ACLOJK_023485 [Asimina triloba]